MWNPDLLIVLYGIIVGIIVVFLALLLAGGNVKAALVFLVGIVLGVGTLTVEHPNALSILFGIMLIIAGTWLMNIIRINTGRKTTQTK
jgi:hypothetical protein